jgi:hypothetical protein
MSNIPPNANGQATMANSQPVVLASDESTLPISVASLPLPTGAATAAKQPALGTAGTASADVITVQGKTSMTPLLVDPSGVTSPVSLASVPSHPVTNAGTFAVQASAGTNLNTSALALDATLTGGTQQTKITDGTNVATVKAASTAAGATDKAVVVAISPNNTVGVTGTFWQATQPVSGTVTITPSGTQTVSGTVTANIGTSGSLALDATLTGGTQQTKITDGTNVATVKAASTAAVAADKAVVVAISPNNTVPVSLTSTTVTGTVAVSIATNTPTIAAGTNLMGKVGIDQTTVGTTNAVTPVPAATGGPTVARIKSAASTNATSVKGSAGQIYGWALYNNTATAKYVKIYNKATSPTVGTDTPAFTIIVPGASAGAGTNIEFSLGVPLGTGVAYAITGLIADSDTTVTAADDVHGVLLYK